MKKVEIGLFLFLVSISTVQTQINTNDTKVDSTIIIEKQLNKDQFKASLKVQAFIVGSALLAFTDNDFFSDEKFTEVRNEKLPDFRTHADDFLPYVPIAAVYGLNSVGIKGRNNFGNRTALLLKSELIMIAMVFPLKNFTHRLRPDGSEYTSFPSGHTAQAFAAATFMHKEYDYISPWYSIGAYTLASSVGVLRVLNNRHYASDVLIGASIGIMSTQLAYLTHQYKWSKKIENKLVLLPIYDQASLGFYMCFTF